MLFDVVAGLVTLGLILYVWLTWNYSYWKNAGVKYSNPSLIFGNLKDIILTRRNPAIVYNDLYWCYPSEPAVGLYRLRRPELMLRDFELVKTVFVKEFNSFHDNPITVDKNVDPILGNNPFVAKGESWKALRAIHTPALTAAKLKGMLPLMREVCKDMLSFLKQMEGKPLDAKYFAGQFTTDVVGSCVFGLSSNSFKDPNARFRQMTHKVFQPTFRNNCAFMLAKYVPSLLKIFRLRFLSDEVAEFFTGVVRETCAYRKKNGIKRNDFLQQLMDENEKHDKNVYTDEEIVGYTMTFFFDGYETSSVLIGHVLYELASRGDLQDELRQEINSAFTKLDDVDFDSVHGLPLLDAIISETLRLYPPGTVLNKQCTRDVVLRSQGKEYPMKEGMPVSVPVFSIHRDPKYFDSPDEFRPERFYKKTDATDGYLPFGLGPRACLGSRFALTQTKVAIVALVLNFRISTKDENPGRLEFESKYSLFLLPKGGLWIKFNSLESSE